MATTNIFGYERSSRAHLSKIRQSPLIKNYSWMSDAFKKQSPKGRYLPDLPTKQNVAQGRFLWEAIRGRSLEQKFFVDSAYMWSGLSTFPDENLSFGIASSGFLSVRKQGVRRLCACSTFAGKHAPKSRRLFLSFLIYFLFLIPFFLL